MATVLTTKQKSFCEYYVSNGFNATQAALSAGYSQDNASQQGCENLGKPYIQEFIQEFTAKAAEKALVTTEDVVKGLMKEAGSIEEDSSPTARISAWKALSDYTGGFDSNKVHNVNVELSHEEWLDSLK
ncbi:MAG: terminase small subunit [Robiginitomaculum sp.]|nr:terminase small subunit [Robiginitomaculum sp.]MBL4870997.1 terminase small subunit [Robiginitomaculum sp.]PHS60372.1 MAG: terminase small subunit [Flavobacterium sp.]